MTKTGIIFLLFLLQSASFAQPFSETEKRIREAQDRRDAAALLQLAAKNPAMKTKVLTALASVQSAEAVDFIFDSFTSKKTDVRAAAAFALGQTLRDAPATGPQESKFLALLEKEKDPVVRAALLDALGRCGKMDALAHVASLRLGSLEENRAKALSIARFAVRGFISPPATAAAGACYPACRKPRGLNEALYALMRIGDSALISPYDTIAAAAIRSVNPDERMHAVAILGRMHTRWMFHAVLVVIRDKEWRVSVNAIRASAAFRLAGQAMSDSLQEAYAAILHRASYQQVKTVLQTIASVKTKFPKLVSLLVRMHEHSSSPDLKEEAVTALARLDPYAASQILDAVLKRNRVSPAGLRAAASLFTAGEEYARFVPMIRANLRNNDPKLATAALESWRDLWKAAKSKRSSTLDTIHFESESLAVLAFHGAKEHLHPGPVETIIETLTDSVFRKPAYLDAIARILPSFSSADNVEAVGTLLDAIAKFKGPTVVEILRPYLADSTKAIRKKTVVLLRALGVDDVREAVFSEQPFEQWNILGRYKTNPVAAIKTAKGTIRIELLAHEAPFTVESFIRLVESGFYDGLTFHRVVPNFVVQGGDPLGDGTGGPPWTIRSEFSALSFERGMVGIASSGRDTEGSQFFIMHAHHPHLDGRYTIFGKVKSGIDAADALEVGDVINSVSMDNSAKAKKHP